MDIKPYLQKMVDRFANPSVQASLKGFTKNLSSSSPTRKRIG